MHYSLTFLVVLLAAVYTVYRQQATWWSSGPTNVTRRITDTHTGQPLLLRNVSAAHFASEQAEGAGARVRRSIGTRNVRNFTPFLMLDHFFVGPDAGFPDHPHRGQETITYVLKGHVDHEDFTGSAGTLGPGDLQFMTAGRGVVHAEMPRIDREIDGDDVKFVEGLQLWVDLPAELKGCEPRYRDLRKADVPIVKAPDQVVEVKVISGQSYGVDSVTDLAYTPVWMLDVTLDPNGTFRQAMPGDFNMFLYIMEGGDVEIMGNRYKPFHAVFFSVSGDGIEVSAVAGAKLPARFLVVGGRMLDQEIVQHGPFVETSRERIVQAFRDYQTFTNGFERARGWASKIGRRMLG